MRQFLLLLGLIAFLIFPDTILAQSCGPGVRCPPGLTCIGSMCSSVGTGGSSSGTCTTTSGASGVSTALGCIPTDPKELVKWILGWSIGIGGGMAFLLSLWGGVTIVLNGSNPEKLNEGKEIIGSAVTGLLFILFSVLLLRLIGVDILGIFS